MSLQPFLFNFIDQQIQKCLRIVHLGIGPNSLISANLVREEVDALIKLALLLQQNPSKNTDLAALHHHAFKIIYFYLEQEHLRVQAAMFASDNPPHREAERLVKVHQALLADLCKLYAIDAHTLIDHPSLPLTLKEYRCKCAMVSLKDIDLILGHTSEPLNDVVAEVIKQNSVPNGYYDQNKSAIISFKAHCQSIILEYKTQDPMPVRLENFPKQDIEHISTTWKTQFEAMQVI